MWITIDTCKILWHLQCTLKHFNYRTIKTVKVFCVPDRCHRSLSVAPLPSPNLTRYYRPLLNRSSHAHSLPAPYPPPPSCLPRPSLFRSKPPGRARRIDSYRNFNSCILPLGAGPAWTQSQNLDLSFRLLGLSLLWVQSSLLDLYQEIFSNSRPLLPLAPPFTLPLAPPPRVALSGGISISFLRDRTIWGFQTLIQSTHVALAVVLLGTGQLLVGISLALSSSHDQRIPQGTLYNLIWSQRKILIRDQVRFFIPRNYFCRKQVLLVVATGSFKLKNLMPPLDVNFNVIS